MKNKDNKNLETQTKKKGLGLDILKLRLHKRQVHRDGGYKRIRDEWIGGGGNEWAQHYHDLWLHDESLPRHRGWQVTSQKGNNKVWGPCPAATSFSFLNGGPETK